MTLTRFSFALPLVALVVACGGRTLDPVGEAPDGGLIPPHVTRVGDAGLDTAVGPTGACVNVVITPDELACNQDSDCIQTNSGTVCEDTCPCGGSAVNNAGASRIATQVQGLENGECECPAFGTPTCVNHACTLCGGFMQGSGCAPVDCTFNSAACDGGTPDADIVDGGVDVEVFDAPLEDTGAACVDVDLSTYSTSCETASDCIVIQAGELCDGACACGGSTVSASEQATYNAAVQSITFGACGCPSFSNPQCLGGQCILCEGANQPPGCSQHGGNP